METSPPIANVITLGAQSVPTLRDFYRWRGYVRGQRSSGVSWSLDKP